MKTWMLAVVVMLSGGMASGAEVRLYAEDGTYLGKAGASRFDPESIDNPFGEYGSKFSPNSIRNPYGKYGRTDIVIIQRPAESSGAAFNRGFQQGYDSTARLAQQRREYAEENERWLRERQEQRARDAERAAIEEQTREIQQLREELEDQRYELEAQRYQQQAMNQPPPPRAPPKKKETYRNGSPFSEEFLISIGYRKAPVEDGERQQAMNQPPPKTPHSFPEFDNLSDEEKARMRRNVMILFGGDPETEEEKAARLKEEGRREWEAIKAQWAAEDARKKREDLQQP